MAEQQKNTSANTESTQACDWCGKTYTFDKLWELEIQLYGDTLELESKVFCAECYDGIGVLPRNEARTLDSLI